MTASIHFEVNQVTAVIFGQRNGFEMLRKHKLETPRLTLRPISIHDADYMLAQLNDPGWIANIGDRKVHTIDAARHYIQTKILDNLDYKTTAFFVVTRKEDKQQEIIGQCGVFKRAGLSHSDLGFAFLKAYCNHGYGYEAASVVIDFAFNVMGLKKLVAITSDENIPSQKLLEKLGMRHTDDLILPNIEGNNRYYE